MELFISKEEEIDGFISAKPMIQHVKAKSGIKIEISSKLIMKINPGKRN